MPDLYASRSQQETFCFQPIGLGPTKILARIANHIAKTKHRQSTGFSVFSLCDQSLRNAVLPTIEVENIWGVGRRWGKRLREIGISPAVQLRDADSKAMRQLFSVVMERMVHELCGTSSCLGLKICRRRRMLCLRALLVGWLLKKKNC